MPTLKLVTPHFRALSQSQHSHLVETQPFGTRSAVQTQWNGKKRKLRKRKERRKPSVQRRRLSVQGSWRSFREEVQGLLLQHQSPSLSKCVRRMISVSLKSSRQGRQAIQGRLTLVVMTL